MSHGNWADSAFTPTHLDAWSKNQLGYTITQINQSSLQILEAAETHDKNHKFTTQNENEYFLMENRQKILFDAFLPGKGGMLIWKINESINNNNNELCYKVALLQADGRMDLENSVNYGDDGDPYPGSTDKRAFNIETIPNTVLCDGTFSEVSIYNITDSGPLMYFVADSPECIVPSCRIDVV